MKRVSNRCWEYKGFTVLKDSILLFPYIVYNDEGFSLEAFRTLEECKGYINKITGE